MNKRRLLKLADLLEADAANKKGVKFDLTAWAKKEVGGLLVTHAFEQGEKVPVSCNTAACAWGLAAISGSFKKQGVGYQILDNGMLVPTFGGHTDIKAAAAFFAISQDEGWFLFDPEQYPTSKRTGSAGEQYVAKRIRDFVAGKVVA